MEDRIVVLTKNGIETEYTSIEEAAKAMDVFPGALNKVLYLRTGSRVYKGYDCKFKEENHRGTKPKTVLIEKENFSRKFETQQEAADYIGCAKSTVKSAIKNGNQSFGYYIYKI